MVRSGVARWQHGMKTEIGRMVFKKGVATWRIPENLQVEPEWCVKSDISHGNFNGKLFIQLAPLKRFRRSLEQTSNLSVSRVTLPPNLNELLEFEMNQLLKVAWNLKKLFSNEFRAVAAVVWEVRPFFLKLMRY